AVAAPAGADTAVFTTAGCSTWAIPGGVTSVAVTAVGAAGTDARNGPGGKGDGVAATVSGLTPGGALDVCVAQGGGPGGTSLQAGTDGGAGGGASGVSRGSSFSSPVVIAGGGGGGGANNTLVGGATGGNAGSPAGTAGQNGAACCGG